MIQTNNLESSIIAYRKLKQQPLIYFENVLGVNSLEDYHKRVINTFWENDRTAVKACHDLGKTFLAARLAIQFLTMFKNSKVITTAPTFNQVEKILWSELRAAHGKAKFPLGGKLNMTDWTLNPEWFALGFSPRNEVTDGEGQGTQSSFQGFHAEGGLLVIFDEATGIPKPIWDMAEGLMTQAFVKFLAIGNPTSMASEFYQCFKSKTWAKESLTCFDSPNLIANGITNKDKLKREIEKYQSLPDGDALKYINNYKVVRPYLLTSKWVVQSVSKWGFDHPLTLGKVFGEFPKVSDKTLVPLDIVEQAQCRIYYPVDSDRKSIGIDVARYGTDSTVLTTLHGKKQLKRNEMYHQSTQAIVGEAVNESKEIGGADIIVVDETGLGGGVVDLLLEEVGQSLPKKCEIRGVQFGAACETDEDKEKYFNLKSRMFGLLRDDLKDTDGLMLLNESIYLEELPTIRFSYNKKGQMVMESKDEFKKRTGRKSPDNSDSLALANFGRYDDLNFGKFDDKYTDTTPTPHASGLNSKRTW